MSRAQEFIEKRLCPPLLHGDERHQQWLREELLKWIPDLEELLRQVESRPVVLDWRDYDPTRILG